MENKKPIRCPLGVPGGVIATLAGLAGVVWNVVDFNLMGLIGFGALFLMALPFIRITMMVHSANDRLDEIEKKLVSKL